jgi:diguanylate cyclase (GGDEF)-like protein
VESIDIPAPNGWDDAVTGVGGPDLWQRTLVAEVARSARYGRALTVVVVEVHGVDQLAASFGGDVALLVLRATAQALVRATRGSDACMRIGPTRFGVVLVETDEIAAINFVERVREDVPRRLPAGADGLRFGFGWASPEPAEAPGTLVRRAETRLMVELLG